MSGLPSRIASVALLTRILDHRQTLDEALSQEERFSALEGPDRGFARAMTSAVLRYLGWIDTAIAPHVKGRAFEELDGDVSHVLRIGVAQICVLGTPLHAAVSETVESARYIDAARKAGGLINAVLRKIQPDTLEQLDMRPASVWPGAFCDMLDEMIGVEAADQLAGAALEIPPLDLTCPRDRKLWSERLGGLLIGPTSVRLSEGVVETLTGYEAGSWWVQDVAATLPVQVLSPQRGERVLDLCAAPGGKTLQLASSGADVTALDRAAKRMRRVEQNLKRTQLEAKCVVADATKWTPDTLFDAVLVDAPCSALGTLRRHPEGPWIKSASDLERFPDIQLKLLQSAAKMVKPGGRLVYCVCTPLPREGVALVDRFISETEGWSRKQIATDSLSGFENCVTSEGDLLTLPQSFDDPGGCDAFFICQLLRAGTD